MKLCVQIVQTIWQEVKGRSSYSRWAEPQLFTLFSFVLEHLVWPYHQPLTLVHATLYLYCKRAPHIFRGLLATLYLHKFSKTPYNCTDLCCSSSCVYNINFICTVLNSSWIFLHCVFSHSWFDMTPAAIHPIPPRDSAKSQFGVNAELFGTDLQYYSYLSDTQWG